MIDRNKMKGFRRPHLKIGQNQNLGTDLQKLISMPPCLYELYYSDLLVQESDHRPRAGTVNNATNGATPRMIDICVSVNPA